MKPNLEKGEEAHAKDTGSIEKTETMIKEEEKEKGGQIIR